MYSSASTEFFSNLVGENHVDTRDIGEVADGVKQRLTAVDDDLQLELVQVLADRAETKRRLGLGHSTAENTSKKRSSFLPTSGAHPMSRLVVWRPDLGAGYADSGAELETPLRAVVSPGLIWNFGRGGGFKLVTMRHKFNEINILQDLKSRRWRCGGPPC